MPDYIKAAPTDYLGERDFLFDVASGFYRNLSHVNKFGFASNCDDGVQTDIWDGANATDDVDVWLAPTAARVHSIVSSSDTDGKTGSPNAAGARTLRIYGLTSWDTIEESEDIVLTGTDAVNTTKSWVIIHRMEVMTTGASGPNVGYIDAIAASDSTITAMIQPGEGQTQMAVYGVSSKIVAYVTSFSASFLTSAGGASNVGADVRLCFAFDVRNQPNVFQVKHNSAVSFRGTGAHQHPYKPYPRYEGPGIFKMDATADTDDVGVTGDFDIILEHL